MQNDIRKSRNNTLISPIREIKSDLGKIVPFIVKETHRLHNSVTELDMAKLALCFFQCFNSRPPLITALRYLALLNFLNGSLTHTKRNLLISNNLDQIWFWKTFLLLFHMGVRHRNRPARSKFF